MIEVTVSECEQDGMTVWTKTVKLFGFSIYKNRSTYRDTSKDRQIGFAASPIQPQNTEEDDW